LNTGRSAATPPTRELEAYASYLEGRHHFLAGTPEALFRSKLCYEQAVARDPSFALAHDALSELYWFMGFFGIMAPREAFSRALWESLRAIELDDTMAEAHALLAMLRKEQDYNWPEVRREFGRALELNPTSPVVRFRHALSGLMPHGHTREAAAELERVLDTDPLSLFLRWWLVVMWLLSRDTERARVESERMVALDASHTLAHQALGTSLLFQGDAAAAVEQFGNAADLAGRPSWLLGWLGFAYAAAGRPDDARALLTELSERSKTSYVQPTAIAFVCLGLGDVDGAFRRLDEAIDVRDPWIVPIRTFPPFDPLRSDPRFDGLLRRMNLA
jgi:serine/threonine-protein kinase